METRENGPDTSEWTLAEMEAFERDGTLPDDVPVCEWCGEPVPSSKL